MLSLDEIGGDIRHAVRALGRDRGFTVTALLTFALCLGANIALFAVVNAAMLFTDHSGMTNGVSTQTPASVFLSQRNRLLSLLNILRNARGDERDGMPMPMELTKRTLQPAALSSVIIAFP